MNRKMIFKILILITILYQFPLFGELTGQEIMKNVDERDDGKSSISTLTMKLINKKGHERIRKIKSYGKDYGKDKKMVMVFKSPADVKGTGFLSWEYDNPTKDDDRWLYMPALRKIRRISGSSNNDYFMGSDFTYDDMGDRNIDEDNHRLIKTENIDNRKVYVVESISKDKTYMYTKSIRYIYADNYVPYKVEFYDNLGLMKILTSLDIKQIDGIWTILKMKMENFREKHQTELIIEDIKYNKQIADHFFTVSTIERGRIK